MLYHMSNDIVHDPAGWHDAGIEADYRWHLFRNAKTPYDQADALIGLSNAMSDLRSWLPGWDFETGTMPWEREDEEQAWRE